MIIYLIVGLIKKILNNFFLFFLNEIFLNDFFLMTFSHYKSVNTFLNRLEVLEEILT